MALRGESRSLRIAGLFAGIGGLELGFDTAAELLCEIDAGARAVLEAHFASDVIRDVADIRSLPVGLDLVSAGFPCQDLSQAGQTKGIQGERSGLVTKIFDLVADPNSAPTWLLLENVPFMLQLDRGEAMTCLTAELGAMGFRWAYRVVDTRSFGLPQRRKRVLLLASRTEDPRPVLFGQDAGELVDPDPEGRAHGFYWTEGLRGLGWAVDAVPTLKGGSSVGIPSPPAIWMPDGSIVTPEIRDAERLQGFAEDWTSPAVEDTGLRAGARWKLVGNAVSVPVSNWVADRLNASGEGFDDSLQGDLARKRSWPHAAWGEGTSAWRVDSSNYPCHEPRSALAEFLKFEPKPLSRRATAGFLERAHRGSLHFVDGFIDSLSEHLVTMGGEPVVAAA